MLSESSTKQHLELDHPYLTAIATHKQSHNISTMSTNNFFPSIRTLAEKTDAIPNIPDDEPPAQPVFEEERPLEEIESLCMSCGEQVSVSVRVSVTAY